MVAQFPEQTTTPAKNLTPSIVISVGTFTNFDPLSVDTSVSTSSRMCEITINVTNIQKPLAIASFTRLFAYVQNLANNDINPILNVNQSNINPSPNFSVTKPLGVCKISADKSESLPIINLSVEVYNLRLDYMDEYFNSTLTYLTNVIANDLNP